MYADHKWYLRLMKAAVSGMNHVESPPIYVQASYNSNKSSDNTDEDYEPSESSEGSEHSNDELISFNLESNSNDKFVKDILKIYILTIIQTSVIITFIGVIVSLWVYVNI